MPATVSADLFLAEAFSSIQGEGLHIGVRQIFVRLCDCNLDCRYCDTDFQRRDHCQIETDPGSGRFQPLKNPVNVETLCALLDQWIAAAPGLHRAISLTGGEPLLHAESLALWLPLLKARLPLHLETNGTLHQHLVRLLPYLDYLSIDLKLASVTGQPTPWSDHRQFLQVASGTASQIKVVVSDDSIETELLQAAELVAELMPQSPLFLQPVTVQGRPVVTGSRLMAWQHLLAATHADCRVVPQIHPFLRIA